jgi:murein DD-endopeptidase MepM/ murein hydrolase activator NlpD
MAYESIVRGGGWRSQEYGCSGWACATHREWNCPTRCNCRYGFHAGIDVAANAGTQLLAVGYGTRVYRRRDPGSCGGLGPYAVCINSGPVDIWYGHCRRDLVGIAANVVPGQPLAEMGTLGCSNGTHLHFEVQLAGVVDGCRSLDPTPYLSRWPGGPPNPQPPNPQPSPSPVPASTDSSWLLLAGAGLLLAAAARRSG